MSYATLNGPVPLDIVMSFNVPGSAPAGTIVIGSFVPDPTQANVTSTTIQAPPDETWIVFDIYSPVQTPAVDGVLQFKLNRKSQNINFGPLSLTYKNVYNALSLKNSGYIVIPPSGFLEIDFVTLQANSSTSAVTVSANVRIMRVPKDYKGPIHL